MNRHVGRVGPYTVEIEVPEVVVPVDVPSTTYGITCDPAEYRTRLAQWQNTRHTRVFGYPGKGIPDWTGGDGRLAWIVKNLPHCRPNVTWKDWPTTPGGVEALLVPFLDAVPECGVDLSHMHEPGPKNVDPTEYRRRWFTIYEIVARHPNAERVGLLPCDANIWVEDKAGGDVSRYAVGVGKPAMDVYARSWKEYPSPAELLATPLRQADALGEAPRLTEFGATRRDDDPTGERRADWINAVCDLAEASGVASMVWWDDLGTAAPGKPAPDFRLDDAPSIAAWATRMHP